MGARLPLSGVSRAGKIGKHNDKHNHDGTADKFGGRKLPCNQHPHQDAEFEDEICRGELKCYRCSEIGFFRIIERAIATAAYEHDEEAAPNNAANVNERVESSGSNRDISDFDTITSMTAENKNPRLTPQNICHSIANDIHGACLSALKTCTRPPVGWSGGCRQ